MVNTSTRQTIEQGCANLSFGSNVINGYDFQSATSDFIDARLYLDAYSLYDGAYPI